MDSDILSTNNIPNVFMDVGNNVRPKSNINTNENTDSLDSPVLSGSLGFHVRFQRKPTN